MDEAMRVAELMLWILRLPYPLETKLCDWSTEHKTQFERHFCGLSETSRELAFSMLKRKGAANNVAADGERDERVEGEGASN